MKSISIGIIAAIVFSSILAHSQSPVTVAFDSRKEIEREPAEFILSALQGHAPRIRIDSGSFSYTLKNVDCFLQADFTSSHSKCKIVASDDAYEFDGPAARAIIVALRREGIGTGSVRTKASVFANSITCTISGAAGQDIQCLITAVSATRGYKIK